MVGDLTDERVPAAYDLCVAHADRTAPPHGWQLADERSDPEVEVRTGTIGGERTVALIAEMLGRDRGHPAPGPGVPGQRQAELFEDGADAETEDRASSW